MKTLLGWMLAASTVVAAPPVKPVLCPDGSELNPGIAFASAPDTGLYLTNGVLCITVHGNTVARYDQNGNVALAGATIGPNAVYSLAAGQGCVADNFGAIALGQNNYAGGIDSFAFGANNTITANALLAGAFGTDHYVAAAYSVTFGDGNTVWKSAERSASFGTGHEIGRDDFSDAGQNTLTAGVSSLTTGRTCASFGLFLNNASDYSLLVGNGPLLRSPLTLTAPSTISIGAGTTTPTATLP